MKIWIILTILSIIISCKQNDPNENRSTLAPPSTTVDKLVADVKNNPDSTDLRMRLINTYDSLGLHKEAIGHTDSLIKRDSFNNGLWFTKGQLQEDSKDTIGAIKSYTKAINIYPSIDAQLRLANLFSETGNPKALQLCETVRKLRMGREIDAACNFIIGVYYSRTGANKTALQFFDAAINDNYTMMEAYMEKGFVYYDSKKYEHALKVFETAITVNNTYADAYYWRAKCKEALGNNEEALLDYQRSYGLDKQLKEAAEAIKRLE